MVKKLNFEYYSQNEFLADVGKKASPQEELQILIRHIDPLQISMLEHDLSKITQPFVFETNLDCRGYDINFENLSFLKSISINVDFSNYAALCKRAGRNVKKILVNFSNLPRCKNILIKDDSDQSFMKYAAELTVSECPLLKALTTPTDMTVKNIEGCPLKFNSMKKNGGFKISKTLLEKKLEEVTNDDDINTADLKEVLKYTPSSQNILLVGRHGIGKSEILTDHFENKGMKVIPLFLGQMADPGDLIGLPHFNAETHHTEYYPPYWFPLDDDKPIVLFLDELNRARPELMQSVMDLALNRKLAGKKLPEGSQVIAAVNAGDEYQVEELDPALVSRFNVYFFNPSAADWISWAEKNDLDDRIINFIEEKPDFLDGKGMSDEEYDNCLFKTPDRRAWKKVSDVIKAIPKLQEKHVKFLSGIIGKEAAISFIQYSMNNEKIRIDLYASQNDDATSIGMGEECNKKKILCLTQ